MPEHPTRIPKWFINCFILCTLAWAGYIGLGLLLNGNSLPTVISSVGIVAAIAVGIFGVLWLRRVLLWLEVLIFWHLAAFGMIIVTMMLIALPGSPVMQMQMVQANNAGLASLGVVAVMAGAIWLLWQWHQRAQRPPTERDGHPLWDEPEFPEPQRPRPRRPSPPPGRPDPDRINKEIAARKQRLNP